MGGWVRADHPHIGPYLGGIGKVWCMLLERDSELELLADLQTGAESVGGRVVLVRGEAGIGKSALVGEFVGGIADEWQVLVGACDDLLTPQTLGPFWDIAREESSLREPLEDGDRMAVMEVLLDLLSRQLRPTVLVLEDTHWADEATLDIIRYVGRRIATTNGLLLLTYRDGEVDYDHPLRRVIGDLPPQNLARVHLVGLSPEAVAALIGDAGLDLDEVLALTDGNPLFVAEVLESGIRDVPLSIQDSVLARASRLSKGGRDVLDLVSVVPGDTERDLIESILGSTERHLAECGRQGLVRVEADTVSFHHELTRRAVESALSPADRRRLNQLVLTELGDVGDASRLVHHAREAGDVESIIRLAPLAAREAMAVESHREAAAHFRALEPYLERVEAAERAAILDDWARNEFYLGNPGAPVVLARAIDLHRSSSEDLALARTLTFAVRLNEVSGRSGAADACAAEAVAILEAYPPSADLANATSQLAWLSMMRGDGARAIELADEAIDLAERTGDELAMIYALNTKGSETYIRGDLDGFRLLEEARARAARSGYPFEETRALLNMASAAAERRELVLAGDLAQRTSDTAARYEIHILEAYGRAIYAEVLSWKGEWAAAEDAATDAVGTHPHADLLAGWVLARLQVRRGRPEARAMLDDLWSLAEPTNEMQNLLPSAAAQAEHMWLTGGDDPDRIARFRNVLDDGLQLRSSHSVGDLALWLWKLGELSRAPDGIPEPYRLVIEGDAMAAADLWAEIGCPYERALALAHGDQSAQLEALDIFEALGAPAVAAKLRKAMRDQGMSVPRGKARATRDNVAGLTQRQTEVLQLLDEGLSNTEIADRLFVSPRTVEHHVSAILSKLDTTTRQEAVAQAHADGLLTGSGPLPASA